MDIRTSSVNFPVVRGSGPQTQNVAVHFPRDVQKATAGITGYSVGFDGSDHHVGNMQIRLTTSIDGDLVNVGASLGLRDWSGNWDDNYDGNIQFVVVAELASLTEPPPRGDLEITGMEFNQATQYFRSAQHLDGPNVRPDNSIPLVARKDTAIRVYVDYDSTSGLPVIHSLSGTLEVSTGFTTLTFSPTNSIAPKRDSQIDRGQVNDTLNFHIPEGNCQGDLTVRCKVFDSANPTLLSRAFETTIHFDEREPLRIYAVGVHYTGQGLDLAAPTLPQITSTNAFSLTEVVYPVPEIFITGYTGINFSDDMKANISDGCGDGYNNLLDKLRDMQGGSNDVYYGFLPSSGFDSGNVGGCGGGSGRVAASPYTYFGGLSQETGHAFGRHHAPCDDSGRCDDPASQDDNYPKYADFASDSIGEFGVNPRTGDVFTPLNNFDFMGYSGSDWVSPYTYMGLLNAFPSSSGVTASALKRSALSTGTKPKMGGQWVRTPVDQLYLWLSIDRKRNVVRQPSFVFSSLHMNEHDKPSCFVAELQDKDGNVLCCQTLVSDCKHCKGDCYPKDFRQFLPYDKRASKLVIWEKEKMIYEETIIPAPGVDIQFETDDKTKSILVTWEPASSKEGTDLWYLVHWRDGDGQWRGLDSRTKNTSAAIPYALFGRRQSMAVRVYCSTGIGTSMAERELALPRPNTGVPSITLLDSDGANVLGAVAMDFNRMVPSPDFTWYTGDGNELSRGRSLSVQNLAEGANFLKVVLLYGGKKFEQNVIVRKTGRVIEVTNIANPHTGR